MANEEHPDYMFVGIFAGQNTITEEHIIEEIERLITKALDPAKAKSMDLTLGGGQPKPDMSHMFKRNLTTFSNYLKDEFSPKINHL